ncbi:HAD hydrolase family protein [uncultured Veillonella sp.]|uniref:HAD hydrolase family protein n=1 Tax=uncultured Veillonella sp. TaxID=159268 RepID=UPI002804B8B4|nr:HAD hydrolase family protein [uncultured Veillonella sp.]
MSSKETLTIKNYIGLVGDKPIRFIASDVDGTLVNDEKAIPEDAIEAIRAARESGIRVAIASGRAWNEMNDVIEKLPCLRYFMCTNGAYVMDKDENRSLFHVNFDKEQALHLLRKLLTYGVYVEAYVKDKIFGMYPPSRCITSERLGACACERSGSNKKTLHGIMDNHLPNTLEGQASRTLYSESSSTLHTHLPGATYDHYALAEGDEVAKVNMSECEIEQSNFFFRPNIRPFILATRTMVCDLLAHMESLDEGPEKIQIFYGDEPMRQRILQDLRDEYQGLSHDGTGRERFYDVLLSSEGNLEFVLPHTTKGTAVEALAKHWGLSPDEVMTLGDSENDLSMLRFAGAGVAMGNSKPNIKETARYETTDNNHQGVAKAIYSAIAYNNELNKKK